MRLRRKPEANDFLLEHSDIVINDYHPGSWHERFGNDHPIHIEIGMGKGDFIIELAKQHPENNYIGIEKYDSVLYVAVKKYLDDDNRPSNLRFLRIDAKDLKDVFEAHEINRVYLNFSDPWPKKRHYKRRLTYKDYLEVYQYILVDQGYIEFKTDNRILFEFSLASMANYPMIFEDVKLDLHKDEEAMLSNIMTEYERKFSVNGPIYKLIAHFK